jgi:hypothetical protein
MSDTRCAPFWVDSPNILWQDASDFFPFHPVAQKCTATALNSLTRFGIYLGLLLALLRFNPYYIGISIGIAIITISAYYGMKSQGKIREGFENAKGEAKDDAKGNTIVAPSLIHYPNTFEENDIRTIVGGRDVSEKPIQDVIGKTDRTVPTGPNPFMNLLINEVKDNPHKPPALNTDTPEMARAFSDTFQTPIYNDPGDVFQHTQNQRTWVVQPISSIPNDQDSFQNWLYRIPGRTCKEGNNAACRTATEGTAVTWLSSI